MGAEPRRSPSNTINTSQGGGPTTIGVNHLMFDPNDGATRMVRLAINGVDCPPVWLEPGP